MGCLQAKLRVLASSDVKFSKQYRRIIKRYLPHFDYEEPTTREDHVIAFQHWERVFKEHILGDARHREQDSMIAKLYRNFYAYLFEHYAYLKPVFRASVEVQSRVIVHISSGMESLLSADDLVGQVLNLALVHMKIGVKPEDFDPLGESLMQAMRITCGDDWNAQLETAWRKIYCHASILILVNIPNAKVNLDDLDDDG
jgi:hemoglobin-like flavoprotein